MKISIAMATYNGARFLREQLDSIAAQTLLPYELVICDDGSTDTTLEIAEQFAKEVNFPVRIYQNESNLGFADNFLKAASLCEGDWIAFSDQDDVWLPHKLASVSRRFNDGVLLVLHSADLVDASLKANGKRWPDIKKDFIAEPLQNRPWWTPAGFTQCVSAELIRNYSWQIRPNDFHYPGKMQAHDKWTYLLANSLGRVAYIEESLALYRRHEETVTGSYSNTIRGRLADAKGRGASHYVMMSKISHEYANILSLFVKSEFDDAKLMSAIKYYQFLSHGLEWRAKLHSAAGLNEKFPAFLRLLQSGAYGNSIGNGLGFKAFLKDFIALTIPYCNSLNYTAKK